MSDIKEYEPNRIKCVLKEGKLACQLEYGLLIDDITTEDITPVTITGINVDVMFYPDGTTFIRPRKYMAGKKLRCIDADGYIQCESER